MLLILRFDSSLFVWIGGFVLFSVFVYVVLFTVWCCVCWLFGTCVWLIYFADAC